MSQRERLLGRRLPPTEVIIRVEFGPAADAAEAEHRDAVHALTNLRLAGLDVADAEGRAATARAALVPFCEVLQVHPIAADLFEQLVGDHPPSEEQRRRGDQWNTATFAPALLAACIGVDEVDPMTEKDWREWWTTPRAAAAGELGKLFDTCLQVNDRSPDVQVGKG